MAKKSHKLYPFDFFQRRAWQAFFCLILLIIILLLRLCDLQIVRHNNYLTLAKENSIHAIPIIPERGLIYDRHGVLLANNQLVYQLVILPKSTSSAKTTAENLIEFLNLSANYSDKSDKLLKSFTRLLQQSDQITPDTPVPLGKPLNTTQLAKFEANQWRFPEATIIQSLIRNYPDGEYFAHVVGYVSHTINTNSFLSDNNQPVSLQINGAAGIEQLQDQLLRGIVGYRNIEVDARGHMIRPLGEESAIHGSNLYLTIDKNLQEIAYQALGNYSGAVVIVNVNNGEILALVSNPSFDPNDFTAGLSKQDYQDLISDPTQPLYNRAIQGLYAPGSTIKPFFALEGLDKNIVSPDEIFDDPGYFILPNDTHIYHDSAPDGHGQINLIQAIAKSCDIYFYRLGYQLGINNLDNILTQFGFGQLTGIDLPNESPGVLPSPLWKIEKYQSSWYPGDTVNMAIGQGYLQVTPLQLAMAAAAIATEGQRFQPRLIKYIEQDGQKVATQPIDLPTVPLNKSNNLNNNLNNNWEIVKQGMEQVVQAGGTGFSFSQLGAYNYSVAGKTGTAQVRSVRFGNDYSHVPESERPDAWFILFAPVDHPEIAMVIMAEHAPGQAPAIARKITDYFFAHHDQIIN